MPELPEVETVKETLKKKLLHEHILNIQILYDGIIATNIDEFKEKIINQEIIDINRIGKFLIMELNNYNLVIHLRMEGKFYIKDFNDSILKHEHVIFTLDHYSLRYHDTRKFGKMYLINKDELLSCYPINKLGLEPWNNELNISYLKDKLNKNIAIKTLLLDQSIICGIGNIYADEILFLSHINPLKKGYELNDKDCLNIINNTKTILEEAIKLGGTTIRSYTSSLGVTGRFQNKLMVHTKEICPICKTNILKIKVNGRGTYYCPNCQKGDV